MGKNENLICVGCRVQHGPEYPQEPTVQLRKDGKVRCDNCARRAQEAAPAPEHKPDDYGRHEVLDRAHVLQWTFEHFIVEHPVVIRTPELRMAAKHLNDLLASFYQLVGRLHLDD